MLFGDASHGNRDGGGKEVTGYWRKSLGTRRDFEYGTAAFKFYIFPPGIEVCVRVRRLGFNLHAIPFPGLPELVVYHLVQDASKWQLGIRSPASSLSPSEQK
jgi:hypothetical protein